MAHDPHDDDERPGSEPPLPPEDRIWRHPSELGAGVSPPAAWFEGTADAPAARRASGLGALAGACLAGAVVAFGAMWLAGPTRTTTKETTTASVPAAARTALTASFGPSPLPTEELAAALGPSLPTVEVQRGTSWTAGTGIWLDASGTLLTAAPLVSGASRILVTGTDGEAQEATVAGTDEATGLTTLVVERTSGTAVEDRTTPARTGEPLAVIGASGVLAGGPAEAATVGTAVVRAVNVRASVGDLLLHDTIQLDRAVPADAVGGVVVDAEGRLVGLAVGNSADEALGAAIAADGALAAGRSLRDHGQVDRAWLGVRATDLDPEVATALRVPGGARLTEVTEASPAETAGLAVGDVVTAIGDEPVDDASDLVVALRDLSPGDDVAIEVWRDGEQASVQATLGG